MSDDAKKEDGELSSITISRSTRLWAIVTKDLKDELATEYQQAIDSVEGELAELDNTSSRVVANLFRTNPQQAMAVRQQMEVEKRRRERLREQLQALKKQADELELGGEYLRGTVDTLGEIKPGDRLSDHMCGIELVLKDGIVQKIRQTDPDEADTRATEFEARMGAVRAQAVAEGEAASEPEAPSGVQIITPGGAQAAGQSPLRMADEGEPQGG